MPKTSTTMPAWIVQTPSRGSVNGIRLSETVSRLMTSKNANVGIGQALKNCISVISKNDRTSGIPLPMATYSASSTIRVMPKTTLLKTRFQSLPKPLNKPRMDGTVAGVVGRAKVRASAAVIGQMVRRNGGGRSRRSMIVCGGSPHGCCCCKSSYFGSFKTMPTVSRAGSSPIKLRFSS